MEKSLKRAPEETVRSNMEPGGSKPPAARQPAPPVQEDRLIRRFTEMAKEVLDTRLAGIYLHGSAAMGCRQPQKATWISWLWHTRICPARRSGFLWTG